MNGPVKRKEKKGLDGSIIAAILAVIFAIVGSGLMFWAKTEADHALVEGRIPWVMRWLNEREKRVEDTLRRVERLEHKQMGM